VDNCKTTARSIQGEFVGIYAIRHVEAAGFELLKSMLWHYSLESSLSREMSCRFGRCMVPALQCYVFVYLSSSIRKAAQRSRWQRALALHGPIKSKGTPSGIEGIMAAI
jgi:hypothetical protein